MVACEISQATSISRARRLGKILAMTSGKLRKNVFSSHSHSQRVSVGNFNARSLYVKARLKMIAHSIHNNSSALTVNVKKPEQKCAKKGTRVV
jgi:hypothetical protein